MWIGGNGRKVSGRKHNAVGEVGWKRDQISRFWAWYLSLMTMNILTIVESCFLSLLKVRLTKDVSRICRVMSTLSFSLTQPITNFDLVVP